MVADEIEHPLGVIYRTQNGDSQHWLIVSARATDTVSSTAITKSSLLTEAESNWLAFLEWHCSLSWRIFIILTIYLNILIAIFMHTELCDEYILIIIQYVLSMFFFIDFAMALMHRIIQPPVKGISRNRKLVFLVIDAVSLLPLSAVYMMTVREYDKEIVFDLSCTTFLRFYRIPQFFTQESYSAGVSHMKYNVVEFSLYFFLSIYTFAIIWMHIIYATLRNEMVREMFKSREEEIFMSSVYFALLTFANTGFGELKGYTTYDKLLCIISILLGYILMTGLLLGSLANNMLKREKPREKYRRQFRSILKYMQENRLGPNTLKKITQEMSTLWNYKQGFGAHTTQKLLPIPLRKEISFDIVFGFLYRSILFANQDRTFLRSVSLIMRNKTYLPGDEIIRPTGISHKMICVTSGIVEILSVENDSSPIISFTAGTVLGEISLFLPLPIKTIIRASTIVEVQTLDMMDFCRLAMKFTSNCSAMRAEIINRCNESLKIRLNDAPRTLDPEEPVNVRLKTLKDFIQTLKDPQIAEDEVSTTKDAFKANIANLYVFIENLPRVKVLPMSLMRNKPWILRPDTPVTAIWDLLMFILVTFVMFYYPYMAAFYRKLNPVAYTVLFIVEFIYALDIVKQCVTAVPRDDLFSYKTEIKEIVQTRLRSYGFYLDVLSTYELSVFTPLFNFSTTDHIIYLLSLNKMLRFWIIPRYFSRMENQLPVNLLWVRIIKYILYIACLTHVGAAILYLEACPTECDSKRWLRVFESTVFNVEYTERMENLFDPYTISAYLALMLSSTTGDGNIVAACIQDELAMSLMIIMGLIAYTIVVSQLSTTFKHIEGRKRDYQEEIYAIDRFLVEHNLPQRLRERMRRYFRVQWAYDRGSSFQNITRLDQLPKKMRTIMLKEKLITLQSIPIFQNAHPGFMLELAKGCQVRVLPDNEMVVYAGSLDREMFILQSGFCTMYNKKNPGELSVIGAYTSFGELEMIQGVPIALDVKTLTHVRIICIEYATYMRAVTMYPDVRRDIEIMMETKKMTTSTINIPTITFMEKKRPEDRHISLLKRIWKEFCGALINVYKYDKRHNRNYWEPFRTWNRLRFLQYIVIPVVIKPNSSIFQVWMVIRLTNAAIIGFLVPVYYTMPANPNWKPLAYSCQIILYLDTYINFHLAYYNSKGILVFHPAKTVVNYIKGSFLIDLLIMIPIFPFVDRFAHQQTPSIFYNGCGLIKVLQYYKVIQACNAFEADILRRSMTFKLLKYLPTILIVTNLLTALLILIDCQVMSDDEPQVNRMVIKTYNTHERFREIIRQHCSKPIRVWVESDPEMFLIAYYYVMGSMTSCGFADIVPTNNTNVIACMFTVTLGIFLYGSMFASIASSKIFAYYNITMYRTNLTEMMTFLGKGNVSEKLKRRIFMHYLQTWGRTYGYTPQKTLSNVHTVLKQDIVDWMYESTLRKVPLFNYVDKYFIRCVGKYIDEIYFLEGEEICKHNHIQDEMYIIYRGKIDILDADGNFVTSMGGGGLFGNMTDKSAALSGITAVAATNVELIRMKAEDFHKTLANYPNVKKEIGRLTSQSPDYITPTMEMEYTAVDEVEEDITSFPDIYVKLGSYMPRSKSITGKLYLRRAIYKPGGKSKINFLIVSGSWLHSVLTLMTVAFSYISCIAITYSLAFQEYGFFVMVMYIVPDIYFYLKIFVEFNITYIDKRNDHICSRKLIGKKYVKSLRFYFDVFSSFPLEIFAFAAPTSSLIAMSFLRLNRLLRFYYFLEFHKNEVNKLMINLFLLEIGTLVAWTSILIHCLACVWYLCACPVFFCFEESWLTTAESKAENNYEKYLMSVYYIVAIVTTTGYGEIAASTNIELIITTLIMVLSHFGLVLGAVTFLAMVNMHSLTFVRYEESLSQYKKDLIRQRISRYQLNKLWKYVQFLWWREFGKQMPVFIRSAPYIMRCDMYIALYGSHLARSYVFSGLEKTFQRQLAVYLRRYIFFPGYYIVQQGDKDGTMYFIHKGEVSVMTIHTDLMETVHYHLKTNDQFGIAQGLIFGEPHVFSYRAETEVELIYLQLSHWQHLLKYFPKIKPMIYERLQKLQYKIPGNK